jgi:hypothetical protein
MNKLLLVEGQPSSSSQYQQSIFYFILASVSSLSVNDIQINNAAVAYQEKDRKQTHLS